jgi:hypothetical protein
MNEPASIEWYVARDGQQFGPVSDAEFRKLLELRHLRPDDLIWREGFDDWRPAASEMAPPPVAVRPPPPPRLPPQSPAPLAPQPAPRADLHEPPGARPFEPRPAPRLNDQPQPARQPRVELPDDPLDDVFDEFDAAPPRRRVWPKRVAAIVFFALTLAAAGWYAWPHRAELASLARSVAPNAANGKATPAAPAAPVIDSASLSISPIAGFEADAVQTDARLQKAALWRILKRDFPDWYQARVRDASRLKSENRADAEIGDQMVQALVALRRDNAAHALAASTLRLRSIAAQFATTLGKLRQHSVDACYGFISRGEASPAVTTLLRDGASAADVHGVLATVFEAIAEGRKSPTTHLPPKQADFNLLLAELAGRGWTQADMQLFSDERALARAPPDQVCRLVTQWFEAHVAIKDQDVQLRLLYDALKPVVSG